MYAISADGAKPYKHPHTKALRAVLKHSRGNTTLLFTHGYGFNKARKMRNPNNCRFRRIPENECFQHVVTISPPPEEAQEAHCQTDTHEVLEEKSQSPIEELLQAQGQSPIEELLQAQDQSQAEESPQEQGQSQAEEFTEADAQMPDTDPQSAGPRWQATSERPRRTEATRFANWGRQHFNEVVQGKKWPDFCNDVRGWTPVELQNAAFKLSRSYDLLRSYACWDEARPPVRVLDALIAGDSNVRPTVCSLCLNSKDAAELFFQPVRPWENEPDSEDEATDEESADVLLCVECEGHMECWDAHALDGGADVQEDAMLYLYIVSIAFRHLIRRRSFMSPAHDVFATTFVLRRCLLENGRWIRVSEVDGSYVKEPVSAEVNDSSIAAGDSFQAEVGTKGVNVCVAASVAWSKAMTVCVRRHTKGERTTYVVAPCLPATSDARPDKCEPTACDGDVDDGLI